MAKIGVVIIGLIILALGAALLVDMLGIFTLGISGFLPEIMGIPPIGMAGITAVIGLILMVVGIKTGY